MGLDVKTGKPARTPGSKYSPGKAGSAGELRNAEDKHDDEDVPTAAQQARFSVTHWTDPTSSFLRVVACLGVPKKKKGKKEKEKEKERT